MGNESEISEFRSSISETDDVILGVIYSLFGLLSVSGNTMLLLVAYRKRSMLKPAEFFIINLAISDLGMTGTLFPLSISSLFAHRWLFDKVTCKYYAFCGVLFGLCSLTNLTVLSTVCCMKVCYPVYGNKFSSAHSRFLLLCVWAYAFVFATAPLADWGKYGPEPYGTACCIDWRASNRDHKAISYIVALFVFCYLIPCTLIFISYTLILLTVKGARRAVKQHLSPQTKGNSIHSLIIKVSVAVCIGFLLAWTPYAVVAMWAAFGNPDKIPPIAFALAAVFAKSSTLYNPMVYLLLKPKFLNVLTKDLSVFQNMCGVVCGGCRSPEERTPCVPHDTRPSEKLADNLQENQGTCRTRADTFECFCCCPRCCNLAQVDATQPVTNSLVNNPTGSAASSSAVHLVVCSSRTRSGVETIEVPTRALTPDFLKDFI
ncbi:opsin-5-like [Rhinophrynus dorsalis]